MLCNQYDNSTGQYVISFLADIDPMNPTRWLVPAFCSTQPLPERSPMTWPFWKNDDWALLPDYRGVRLYRTDTGAPAEITKAGVKPEDAGLTTTPRPSDEYVWSDGKWVVDAAVIARKEREAAMNAFLSRMEKARAKNLGKADALAAGQLDAFERACFDAWAQYQMKLVRVVEALDFPASLAWPAEPDEEAIRKEIEAKLQEEKDKEKEKEAASGDQGGAGESAAPSEAPDPAAPSAQAGATDQAAGAGVTDQAAR
ncbi:tail fiber assembly protein [Burkholderia mayonis]|uniref:tail fiber assembly protein n=1 Tax=Burkholderia mayonis TaxID=1385591 RepID=UPI0009E84258|nr:tail fiber assembly protein [Burkholderia mayonis]